MFYTEHKNRCTWRHHWKIKRLFEIIDNRLALFVFGKDYARRGIRFIILLLLLWLLSLIYMYPRNSCSLSLSCVCPYDIRLEMFHSFYSRRLCSRDKTLERSITRTCARFFFFFFDTRTETFITSALEPARDTSRA